MNQRQGSIWDDDEEDISTANSYRGSNTVTYKSALNQNIAAQGQSTQKKSNSTPFAKSKNQQSQNNSKTKVVVASTTDFV